MAKVRAKELDFERIDEGDEPDEDAMLVNQTFGVNDVRITPVILPDAGSESGGGGVLPHGAHGPEGADQLWTPCTCVGDCSPTCSCKKIRSLCQSSCSCSKECSNKHDERRGADVAKILAREGILTTTDSKENVQLQEEQEAAQRHPQENKEEGGKEREVKTKERGIPTTLEELTALVLTLDEGMQNLIGQVKKLTENEKAATKQLQEISRENTALKQELKTKEAVLTTINARVARLEARPEIKALAAEVAADIGLDAMQAAPVVPQARAPAQTFLMLVTGMPEAKEWEADDFDQIRRTMIGYRCGEGILRAERLGRRQRGHRGMGRFVLMECTEECAHIIRNAVADMNKDGMAVRPAKQGFRRQRGPARREPGLLPPGVLAADHGPAQAAPLQAAAPVAVQPPAQGQAPVQADKAPAPVCRLFQKGECTYGRQCRYQHVRVCFDYAGGQRCRFANQSGRGCKFVHVRWDGAGDDQGWNDASAWRRDDLGTAAIEAEPLR